MATPPPFNYAPAVPYLGQIATRCYMPFGQATGYPATMSRSMHWMRESASSFQLVYYGGIASSSGEVGLGATTTITASIEYPAATFTQVKFSGSPSGSYASGAFLVSDAVSLSIPRGAQFWVRAYQTNANGLPYCANQAEVDVVDLLNFSPSSDQTMGGSVSNTLPGNFQTPFAIIGMTTRPSVYLEGDSRMFGHGDGITDLTGDSGPIGRLIGPNFAYINGGIPAANAATEAASFTFRKTIAGYCSHAINQIGINDTGVGSVATLLANRSTVDGFLNSSVKTGIVFGVTMEPYTTSTDSWATEANQTVSSAETNRVTANADIRAGTSLPFESQVIDVDRAYDPAASGKWPVGSYYGLSSGAANTADGLHANLNGVLKFVQPYLGFDPRSISR